MVHQGAPLTKPVSALLPKLIGAAELRK